MPLRIFACICIWTQIIFAGVYSVGSVPSNRSFARLIRCKVGKLGQPIISLSRAPQESYDKQIIRNYLLSLGWDRRPPAAHLPPEIVARAAARYQEICERLTGEKV